MNECIIEITSCAALPYPESMITAASVQIRPRMNESVVDVCKINNQTEFTIQFYVLEETYTCEYNDTVNEAMPCNTVPITVCKTPRKEVVTSQTNSYIHVTTKGYAPLENTIGSTNVNSKLLISNNDSKNCTDIQECYNGTATSMTFTNFVSSNSDVSTAATTLINSAENCTIDCNSETTEPTTIHKKSTMPQSATANIQSTFAIVITSATIISQASASAFTTYIVIIVTLSICLIGLLIFITVYCFRIRKKRNQSVDFRPLDIGLNEMSNSISSNYSKI